MNRARRVALYRFEGDPTPALTQSLEWTGLWDRISSGTRVALKPNLTYPYHKPGVTTTPEVLAALARLLRQRTRHLAIVESFSGYGGPPGFWEGRETLARHGANDLAAELGLEVVDLAQDPREEIEFQARGRTHRLGLPRRLLHETDLLLSLPVPKIHAMTGVSLAFKNQWGCITDPFRQRWHHLFDEAVVAINRALQPAVVGDATHVLDRNGPMQGEAVQANSIIAATDPGAFDRYVTEWMGVPWQTVLHLRGAARLGEFPRSLDEIAFNVSPAEARLRTFRLELSWRNRLARAGFRSRFLTWLGWESWFGRVVVHGLLYAVAGRMVEPETRPPE